MDKKKKILIVEDNEINRIVIKKILSQSYYFVEAENGQIAIDILNRDKNITAILLDIVMPVLDGYGVLEYLNKNQYNIPVVVMTGEDNVEEELKALSSGAWDFVAKPLQAKILLTRLNNAIIRSETNLLNQLRKQAEHDNLTGFYNRNRFFKETRLLIKDYPFEKFVFVKLDLDHFNSFNATYGEEVGDDLIGYMANWVEKIASEYDLCSYGRIDADIFCMCFPYDEEKLMNQVIKVKNGLRQYRYDCLLKPSFGGYIINDSSLSIQRMYMRASIANKECKKKYEVYLNMYSKEQGDRYRIEYQITNEMENALENEQFMIYLQPKFRLVDDREYGAEVLVRWNHPEKGIISPACFVPIFERNGFIAKLDYYVWEKSCQLLRKWIDNENIIYPISVNVSRVCMYDLNLTNVLKDLIDKYQIPIEYFYLEITESAYMSNPILMHDSINQLRDAGFVILMDDFGCGYSSLNTLKDINVDVLKIDMDFLPVDNNLKKGEIILASMIKMSKWLGLDVVVEGVETKKQKDFLLGIGCEYVQGYFYAKPMSVSDYENEYVYQRKNIINSENNEFDNRDIVIVVDDDEMSRDILTECYKDDFCVCSFKSAEEAMVCLKNNASRTKLIVIDNVLPGLSGFDFLEFYHNDPIISIIPKMMITSSDDSNDQIKAFKLGVQEFIQKPLDKRIIKTRSKHVLDIHNKMKLFIEQEEKYKSLIIRDKATNLLNKTSFIERCEEVLRKSLKNDYAFLILDIDDFKSINDNLGHLIGDEVIKIIAREIILSFRQLDICGRFGGDEFVVLMSEINNHDGVCKKVNNLLKRIINCCYKELMINVSVSVGISYYKTADTFEKIFLRADKALYEVKNSVKGRINEYGDSSALNDVKPIILVCGDSPRLYPEIALSYDNNALFVHVVNLKELKEAFNKYPHRIKTVCLEMKRQYSDSDGHFYNYLMAAVAGSRIPILGICNDGNLNQIKKALKLDVYDIITIPSGSDTIHQKILKSQERG